MAYPFEIRVKTWYALDWSLSSQHQKRKNACDTFHTCFRERQPHGIKEAAVWDTEADKAIAQLTYEREESTPVIPRQVTPIEAQARVVIAAARVVQHNRDRHYLSADKSVDLDAVPGEDLDSLADQVDRLDELLKAQREA